MKKMILIFSTCALLTTPAFAMSDAECKAEWTKADVNKDGALTAAEAERYFASMRVANKTMPSDSRMTDVMFMEHCKADLFKTAKAEPGAPFAGANSFTENQAKDRIVAAGFGDVGGLKKDDKGIWRGKAKQGDKAVDVAVDFKGNVVTN